MDKELARDAGGDKKFAVTVTSPSQCKRVLSIEIPESEVEGERARIAEKLRRELKVPGFRKGKVPLGYVKKNYAEAVHAEAVQNLLPRAYEEAVRGEGLRPLGEPDFENLKTEVGSGISVDASIEVRPDVHVEGYRDVRVEVKKNPVDEAKIDDTVESLRERLATYQVVDRPAGNSDFLVIDYAPLFDNGEINEKARQKGYPVDIASDNLLPEFREGLIGKKAGDETSIEVHYPEDFAEKNLAGKNRTFTVKVSEVKEKLLPVVDDAFAKRISEDIESVSALREKIRGDLDKEEEHRLEHEVSDRIIDKLIEQNEFEVPEIMVENYLSSLVEEDRKRRPNVDGEEKRVAEIRKLFRDSAVRTIKRYFILDAVRRQESLSVGKEEVDRKIESLAEGAGRSVEEVRKYFRDPEQKRNIESDLLDQKVLKFLKENADIQVT